ncbi:ATP-binding protein [Chondromyces apiculatus]|nr:ATP-binding protein [Chondromyces apiculatus]
MTGARQAKVLADADADALNDPAQRVLKLQSVATALASATTVEEVAAVLVEAAMVALGATGGALGLLSNMGQEVALINGQGLDPTVGALWARSPLDAPFPLTLVSRHGEPLWASSSETHPHLSRTLKLAGVAAMACVPLRCRAGVVGALAVFFDRAREFSAGDRAFLGSLERAGRRALERASSHDAESAGRKTAEDAAARLRRLQRVTAALSRAPGFTEVAAVAAREALEGLGAVATVALLMPAEKETPRVVGEAGEAAEIEGVRDAMLLRYLPEVLKTHMPWWPRAEPGTRGAGQRSGARLKDRSPSSRRTRGGTFACVPFLVEGQPVGALGVRMPHPDGFGEEEQTFLLTLAELCGHAVERAKLFEEASAHRARAEAAVREAALASRAKDQFFSMISHELRSPLTVVLGWAQMLQAGVVKPEHVPRAIEMIDRNARLQARLVDDLLDTSRVLSGKLGLEKEPMPLCVVVERAVAELSPGAAAKHLTLEGPTEVGTPAMILADPKRMEQVVANLIGNALKFTPEGGTISVTVGRRGSMAFLEVADTGQGIEEELLPHIFEPFRQGVGNDSRRHGGLGLGLAIVRHLVEAHEGTIHAESAGRGHGTKMVVEIPLLSAQASETPGPDPALPRRETEEEPAKERPNPGDPGPELPEPRVPVDPADDPRLPVEEVPRGV